MELENLDLYAELGVPEGASEREIVSAYRKKALKFHPDKNPLAEAKHKFQLLTAIYAVLSDLKLREQYEKLRKQKEAKDEGLNEDIRRFREQLRRAEEQQAKVYEDAGMREQKIHFLQKEAQDLRYQFERERNVEHSGYVSYRDLDFSGRLTSLAMDPSGDRVVEVKWKLREEKEAQINDAVLAEIMAVFGAVDGAKVQDSHSGYVYGTVVYEQYESATAATTHDYRQRATRWDNTRVRKAASLLRGCKRQQGQVPASAYAELVLEQLTGRRM